MAAVDFEDAEAGKMEAGSGIKVNLPPCNLFYHAGIIRMWGVGIAIGGADLTREGSTV